MSRGEFAIGGWQWSATIGGFDVKYESAADNLQMRADGMDDARQTFRGRLLAVISLALEWKADRDENGNPGPTDRYVDLMLTDISPRGAKAGKSWAWVETDQRKHNVNNVTVDKMSTAYPRGQGKGTAQLTLSSWTKPAQRPAVTATPTTPNPWSPTTTVSGTVTAAQAPGFATTPVTVKP